MIHNYLNRALSAFEQALEEQLENQAEWQQNCQILGNILQSMGWFDDALAWHSRLVESQHNLVEIYTDLGTLYSRLQQWEPAIKVYERLIQLHPEQTDAYWQLGNIYAHTGNREGELECWYEILTQQPEKGRADGHYKLAKAFAEIGKTNRAITCYRRSLEHNPQLLAAYYDLAAILTNQGQWEEAIACYNQLLTQDSQQAKAHYLIGQLWLAQGHYSQATAEFQQHLALDTNYAHNYLQIVSSFNKKQQWQEAINLCNSIIDTGRSYPSVYIQLGNALIGTGEKQAAISSYQKAGELRGWHSCVERDYQFTQAYFNYRIPIFSQTLQHLSNQPEINALEIGSSEGMSACWLLDNILTHSTAKLTCIAPQFDPEFTTNIKKTGVEEKVTCLQGLPPKLLTNLAANTYDLINIQDKCKLPERVRQNTEGSWRLLKTEGTLIFSDYQWENPHKPEQKPQLEIDAFLATVKGKFEIIYQAQQLAIKK